MTTTQPKLRAILLFGYPGSGKGTQGQVLGGMPNLVHLSSGDIFRALDRQSPIGQEFLSYSTKGLLVPDDLTVRVFEQHVGHLEAVGRIRRDYHVLILDGIPRTPAQVTLLNTRIDVLKVVHLVMRDLDGLVRRLSLRARKANRPDDADESVIRKRIEVYERETQPVLACFAPEVVAEVDADQHPLAVLRDITSALLPVVPAEI